VDSPIPSSRPFGRPQIGSVDVAGSRESARTVLIIKALKADASSASAGAQRARTTRVTRRGPRGVRSSHIVKDNAARCVAGRRDGARSMTLSPAQPRQSRTESNGRDPRGSSGGDGVRSVFEGIRPLRPLDGPMVLRTTARPRRWNDSVATRLMMGERGHRAATSRVSDATRARHSREWRRP